MRYLIRTVLLTVLVLAGLGASSQMTDKPAEAALHTLIDRQTLAWNQGDATAWAAGFAEDADFVNIRGDLFEGHAMIVQRHAALFAGPFQGSHATVTIRKMTFPAPGMAVIETIHEVTHYRGLAPGVVATADGVLRTRMKYIAQESNGAWHFLAAQNTAILPAPPSKP